jgi:Ca2+-transporting ATPase
VRKHFSDHPYLLITKGAPDRLLEWASGEHMLDGTVPLTAERRQVWREEIDEMAKKGLRVLGAAYRPLDQLPEQINEEIERNLNLLGLIGILDPARPEAREAVKTARAAGIRTIMITGDHALTAQAIAVDLGIVAQLTHAITGTGIEKMSDIQLTETLKTHNVFARVAPEHKLRLVKMLQAQGEVVAMTGDGVNDAPALKQADIGVAMGITGTDVSKGAADMVLTDDNFATIVAAVEEGRTIYDNIRKFVLFLLSSNLAEILVMFVGILVGLPIPLLAIQILWVNLITDGLPAIALGFDPTEPGVMQRPPRPKNESIFAHGVGRKIITRSILLSVLTLGAFLYAHSAHGLDPFSSTLGLERLSGTQLIELIGYTPNGWDSLSESERQTRLQTTADDNHEGESEIVARADRIPRTVAFTVLALGQIFHVLSIHAGDRRPFFRVWFSHNRFMLWAVLSTFALQLAVIYLPFLQYTFETYPIRLAEMIATVMIASVMLFGPEGEKWVMLRRQLK